MIKTKKNGKKYLNDMQKNQFLKVKDTLLKLEKNYRIESPRI